MRKLEGNDRSSDARKANPQSIADRRPGDFTITTETPTQVPVEPAPDFRPNIVVINKRTRNPLP